MADLQLTIRYRPPAFRPINRMLRICKWLYFVILPSLWLTTLMLVMLLPWLHPLLYSYFIPFMGSVFILGLGAWFVLYLLTLPIYPWNSYIAMSRDNFIVPSFLTMREMLTTGHIWSEVV